MASPSPSSVTSPASSSTPSLSATIDSVSVSETTIATFEPVVATFFTSATSDNSSGSASSTSASSSASPSASSSSSASSSVSSASSISSSTLSSSPSSPSSSSSSSSSSRSSSSLTPAPTHFLAQTSTASISSSKSSSSSASSSLPTLVTSLPLPSTLSISTSPSPSIFEPIPTNSDVSPDDSSNPNGAAHKSGSLKPNNRAKIAGGVVGGIVGAALLAVVALLLLRCRRKKITRSRTAHIRVVKRNGNGDSWFGDFARGDPEAAGDMTEKRGAEVVPGAGHNVMPVNPPHISGGLSNEPTDWTFYRPETGSLFSGIMPPPPPMASQAEMQQVYSPPSYQAQESSSPNSSAPFIMAWGQQQSPNEDASVPHGMQVGSPVMPEIVINSPVEQATSPQNFKEPEFERVVPVPRATPTPISITSMSPVMPTTELAYTAITTPTTLQAFDTQIPTPNSTQSTVPPNSSSNPFRKSTQTLWSQMSEESRYSVPSPATYTSLYQQYNSPPVPPLPAHVQGNWMPESPMYTPSPTTNFPIVVTPTASGRSMRGSVVTTTSRFSIGESPIDPPVKRRLW